MTTLRPAEEVAEELKDCASEFLGGVEWSAPVAAAIIHADRIATARRVLRWAMYKATPSELEAVDTNPTALEALLLKETK